MDKKEVVDFINYLQDKVEGCYEKEVNAAVKVFLERLNGTAPILQKQEQFDKELPINSMPGEVVDEVVKKIFMILMEKHLSYGLSIEILELSKNELSRCCCIKI